MNLQQQQQAAENDENCTGTSNWTLNTSANSSRAGTVCCGGNDGDDLLLKEMKLKMETLEAKNQMLEGKLEILELKAVNRALKEEAAQKTNNAALQEKVEQLKDEFSKILVSWEEKHQKEIAELKKANEQTQIRVNLLWKHVTMVSGKTSSQDNSKPNQPTASRRKHPGKNERKKIREAQQQQPKAGPSSSVDATAPPTANATVDSL